MNTFPERAHQQGEHAGPRRRGRTLDAGARPGTDGRSAGDAANSQSTRGRDDQVRDVCARLQAALDRRSECWKRSPGRTRNVLSRARLAQRLTSLKMLKRLIISEPS
jgi:hypothetical protein